MKFSIQSIFFRVFALSLLTVFSALRLQAQLYKVGLDEKIKNAPFIAEGKVINKKSFWNEAHTMIFTTNTVEIYKVFKGEKTKKTIEILTEGGSVATDFVEVSDVLQLDKNAVGIFFCGFNSIDLQSPFTGKKMYEVYSGAQGFFCYNIEQDFAYAPFATYKNIEGSLYKVIEQKAGQPLHVVNNTFHITAPGNTNKPPGNELIQGTISSLSPSTVTGGTFNDPATNILTINGSGFGAVPSGSCGIRFVDGSPPNTANTIYFTLPYKSFYIVSWTDTKIVVKVPPRAASGNVAVIASSGAIAAESVEPLNVFYSLLNATFLNYGGYDSVFSEPRLMNTNSNGGYTLLYSTNTAGGGKNFSTATEKATFQRALTTWKEQVGVNFEEGGTTTIQKVAADGQNVIMFDNGNTTIPALPSGTLAKTISFFSACINTSPLTVFTSQKVGFDLVIRNQGVSQGSTPFTVGPCFPSQDEYDLETVILHELGHALNLAHINDPYEGNVFPNFNPSKLMNFSILNYVSRRSLDVSAYEGALYAVKKLNANYGGCSLPYNAEMGLLSYTEIPTDNCPATFPATATPDNTVVSFDLIHATSNKDQDPQYTAVDCSGKGVSVTNNAFYAFRTSSTNNGTLSMAITGYTTAPADLSDCAGQGISMSVYDVSICPAGQGFPAPITCRTFSGDGAISDITGLQASHNYLFYFDGIRNTKASFNVGFNGDGIPPPPVATIALYPNPVTDLLKVDLKGVTAGKYQFQVYDMLGHLYLSQEQQVNSSQIITLSLNQAASGIYIVKITGPDGNIVLKQKVLKGLLP